MIVEYDGAIYEADGCKVCGSNPRIRTVEHCLYVECANPECENGPRTSFASAVDALTKWNNEN